MDFLNRGGRQAPAPATSQNAPSSSMSAEPTKSAPVAVHKMDSGSMRYATAALLFCVTILLGSLIVFVGTTNVRRAFYKESLIVKDKQYQAVFLNGGQVYFGKVKELNTRYVSLQDIYYLRVNQQIQPGQANANQNPDISLAKLGGELHGPEDAMVINRDQVLFWENLKDDGQVVKAIKEFQKNGGKTSDQSSTTPPPAAATPTTTPTTNTNTTTTKPSTTPPATR